MRSFLIAVVMASASISGAAAQVQPTVITLACDGTARHQQGTPQVTKVGVIVNLAERTVSFAGYVAHIRIEDAHVISFGGDPSNREGRHVVGDIDRITGTMTAGTDDGTIVTNYELVCKAASRLF